MQIQNEFLLEKTTTEKTLTHIIRLVQVLASGMTRSRGLLNRKNKSTQHNLCFLSSLLASSSAA